jgi:hypothetical protein
MRAYHGVFLQSSEIEDSQTLLTANPLTGQGSRAAVVGGQVEEGEEARLQTPPAGCTKFTPLHWEHCIGSIQQPHESLAPPTRQCFELHKRDFDADAGSAPKNSLSSEPTPSHNTPATHTHARARLAASFKMAAAVASAHSADIGSSRAMAGLPEQHESNTSPIASERQTILYACFHNCVSSHSVCLPPVTPLPLPY